MDSISHFDDSHAIPDAQTDHISRKMFDIVYANISASQKLDIYWPEEGNGPFPVILAIHGGAFMMGDKRDLQLTPMLEGLKRGYAVVSINYRMSGEALFPALLQDAKAAVRWVRANAAAYLFDPHRIAVWGGSAGGWQSLMVGVSAGVPELSDLSLGNPEQPENVQAVVAWFPPTDFLKMDEQLKASGLNGPKEEDHSAADSPESRILGKKITEIPELVQRANPTSYVRKGLPSFLIQHGTHDNTVPYQQSMNFAAHLDKAAPGSVRYELLLNAAHADKAFETDGNVSRVLDFLDCLLKE